MIVFKSDALAFVELEMKARGILDFPIDLHNPDFTKIAEGAGLLGLRAETPEQVEPMMAEASRTRRPRVARGRRLPPGTLDAADDYFGRSQRLYAFS